MNHPKSPILQYISEAKLEELRKEVNQNLKRYSEGNFLDQLDDNGWKIEAKNVIINHELLDNLDGSDRTAQSDRVASEIIYKALQGMTPALACEERIWVRLAHIECLEYSRSRWLRGHDAKKLEIQVLRHMFGKNRNGIRDDHALARLWWNWHIATIACPDDPAAALDMILKTADIRSNFVERPNTAARPSLARAIVRAMQKDQRITMSERAFREFMIVLNRNGGGLLFETMPENEIDDVMNSCIEQATARLGKDSGKEQDKKTPESRGLGWIRKIFN